MKRFGWLAVALCAVTALAEQHYDFRKRIDAVHTPDVRDPSATKAADEISLADGVTLALPAERDDILQNAVRDFKDYLKVSMGVKVERWSGGEVETCGKIEVLIEKGVGERSSRI